MPKTPHSSRSRSAFISASRSPPSDPLPCPPSWLMVAPLADIPLPARSAVDELAHVIAVSPIIPLQVRPDRARSRRCRIGPRRDVGPPVGRCFRRRLLVTRSAFLENAGQVLVQILRQQALQPLP